MNSRTKFNAAPSYAQPFTRSKNRVAPSGIYNQRSPPANFMQTPDPVSVKLSVNGTRGVRKDNSGVTLINPVFSLMSPSFAPQVRFNPDHWLQLRLQRPACLFTGRSRRSPPSRNQIQRRTASAVSVGFVLKQNLACGACSCTRLISFSNGMK
jgi:hypothetical protein